MRITNTMLIDNMMKYIGGNLGRMNKYQGQLGTGKKIQKPSDDPVVAARALKLRTDVAEIGQYKRNINDAKSWLEVSESTLGKLGDVLHRVRELAVKASSGTNTQSDTQKILKEVKQLKTQVVHQANTTYAGRYLFSGFKTDTKLINDDEGDIAFGQFNMDVLNTEAIKYEIGIGDNININVPGGDLFNSGADAAASGVPSMIGNFDSLIAALSAGDNEAISSMIGDIDADMDNVSRVRADVGARVNRLELTANRLDTDNINFTRLMTMNEDVDAAEAIMNLKNEENVYRASLAGGARIIMPSLIDFLR